MSDQNPHKGVGSPLRGESWYTPPHPPPVTITKLLESIYPSFLLNPNYTLAIPSLPKIYD